MGRDTRRRSTSYENGGRDWTFASTSQEMPRLASKAEDPEEVRMDPFLRLQRERGPAQP